MGRIHVRAFTVAPYLDSLLRGNSSFLQEALDSALIHCNGPLQHKTVNTTNGTMRLPTQLFVSILGLTRGILEVVASKVQPHNLENFAPVQGFKFEQATTLSGPTIDKPTTRYSHLRQVKGSLGRRSAISAAIAASASAGRTADEDEPHQNITTVTGFSTQYAIRCEWDESSVWLLFDTGSSDTWSAGRGFRCGGSNGGNRTQSSCGLAQPYIDGFSGGEVADVHFALKYGSGETVSGPMGYSDIACGGLGVSGQQVGLANATHWRGNNVTSGILGLAYPALTSAYYGKIGDEAPWNTVTYPPFLTNAISQGSIDPTFSVAIIKNSTDGVLAWGGLPPVSYDKTSVASTELIIVRYDVLVCIAGVMGRADNT